MKKVITIILVNLLILTSTLLSQIIPKVTISGKIADASNNQPLENVDVFLSFTTRGDVSDRDGKFIIENIPAGKYLLVVSLIGYVVIKEDIQLTKNSNREFNFRLKSRAIKAPEIEVRATHAHEWRNNYKKFKKAFLGASDNAEKCNILNPAYIELTYSPGSDNLNAKSKQPVVVENKALGYQITFDLLDFSSNNFFETKYMVTAKFKAMAPKDEKEAKSWKKNRNKSYRGSMRHFFTSLATGNLEDEDFEVYQTSRISHGQESSNYKKLNLDEAIKKGPYEYEQILTFNKYLKIIYYGEYEPVEYSQDLRAVKSRQISWIELSLDSVTFNTSGLLSDFYSVLTYGFWAWERAAEMLPLDYKPDVE